MNKLILFLLFLLPLSLIGQVESQFNGTLNVFSASRIGFTNTFTISGIFTSTTTSYTSSNSAIGDIVQVQSGSRFYWMHIYSIASNSGGVITCNVRDSSSTITSFPTGKWSIFRPTLNLRLPLSPDGETNASRSATFNALALRVDDIQQQVSSSTNCERTITKTAHGFSKWTPLYWTGSNYVRPPYDSLVPDYIVVDSLTANTFKVASCGTYPTILADGLYWFTNQSPGYSLTPDTTKAPLFQVIDSVLVLNPIVGFNLMSGSGGVTTQELADTAAAIRADFPSGVLEAHGTDQAQIKTAGTTALSVTTTQQVGVGNNTPGASALLSVGRSSDAYSQLHVGRGGNGGMYHLSFTDDIGIISQGASFGASGFTARSTSAMNLRFDNGSHIFQANTGLTAGNTFSPTQIGKFNSTGFRIGTGDPAYKLDVSGTGNFTGLLTVDNFIRATGASATLQTSDRADANKRVSIYMNSGIALFNTTNYGVGFILFDDSTGNTGIGGTTPTTSRFTLPASTTTGSSFRVLAGAAPTSPVNGDVWNTTADWFTYLGSTTAIIPRVLKGSATLDFPDTASGSSSSLTITVTGAATTDSGVSIQRDNASIGGTFYEAVITGANTITVYFHNFSGSNQNPTSGTFRATVTK